MSELQERLRRIEALLSKPHLLNAGEAADLELERAEVCLAILAQRHDGRRWRDLPPAARRPAA